MELQVYWQIFHNGIPVRLVYLKETKRNGDQIWRVQPLFVEEPERDEVFRPEDRITFLHTRT